MATVVNRQTMSDAELIAASRAGDTDAYAELYRRHEPAARAAARALCGNRTDADDLVADAFVSVLRILQNGNGPDMAFRPYLLVAVRNRFYDRTRQPHEDPVEQPTEELDLALVDSAASGEDRMLAAAAFATLPERWQLVLWHTEIEGRAPKEIAPLIGLAPNAVAALAYRAREGLRQAYLQAHLQTPHEAGCADCVSNLAAYVRNGLSDRDRRAVDEHLAECDSCRELLAEVNDTNGMLRASLLPAIAGVPAAAYLSQVGTKGVIGWFGRLSRLQQAGAASSAAAAAVVAGVMAAAVMSTGGTDQIIASAANSTRSPATSVVDTGPAGASPATTTATTVVLTTMPAESTVVSTTLPLGPVSRVPIRQVPVVAASTTTVPATTVPDTAAPTTAPTTTVPAVARLTLTSAQIGVALLGGQVRIGLTVSAASLPTSGGARAFTNLVVAVPLPNGVQLVGADNPGWSCTSTGTCTIASLTSGSSTSTMLTLDVSADVTLPISFAPAVTNPPGAVVQSQPLSVVTRVVPGLLAQKFDRGSVTAIGNTVCLVVICLPIPTTDDLVITGTVTKAVLVWSGVSTAGDKDEVELVLPNDDVIAIAADQVVDGYSGGYQDAYVAHADVTSLVTSGGTYGVSNLRTSAAGYGGWSLIVLTHDDTQPQRSLVIAVPFAYVTATTPYSLDLGGVATATSDAHVIASAFEGSPGLLGAVLTLNGFTLADPFQGVLSTGVDLLDVSAVDIGDGSGTLDVSTSNDPIMLAAVGVTIDLS